MAEAYPRRKRPASPDLPHYSKNEIPNAGAQLVAVFEKVPVQTLKFYRIFAHCRLNKVLHFISNCNSYEKYKICDITLFFAVEVLKKF